MAGSTLILKKPIKLSETESVTELNIREPKAKDFRDLPMQPTMGDILDFAAKLCGQRPAVIDELGVDDMLALSEAVTVFMPAGLEIGSKQ